ncbi:hypothetical protein PHJA_000271200 [Phtheirospermum japonicum]|uniref:Uncharacterized protein n=1 Tax=Phtheirospermum japonicum TaxID=374723 RepID=A0A830B7M8_9LAMI|nr:hypothetical protein PHJA_000271200 [Phtheirospermum japonicum]
MYLIDASVGRLRIATQNDLIKPPKTSGPTNFSNQVGFLNPSNRDLPVKNLILQRYFVDLVTGDSRTKQQATARFDDIIGQNAGAQPCRLLQQAQRWISCRRLR